MALLRRRLASCAFALMLVQAALVVAAPVSACCSANAAAAHDDECCPAGSHPPGQCPRHAGSQAAAPAACRMLCDAPHGFELLTVVAGILPGDAAIVAAPIEVRTTAIAFVSPLYRTTIPDSPPPRRR